MTMVRTRVGGFLRSLQAVLIASLATGCGGILMQPISDAVAAPQLLPDAVTTADSQRLPMIRWGPIEPDAVVLGLHGFTEHAHSFSRLAVELGEHNIAFYAYDQRGFGSTAHRGIWASEERMVDDARITYRLLREKYPDTPLYMLGMSMGSAVTILSVTGEDRVETDGIILVSPAIWGRDIMPWYQQAGLWVGVRTIPGVDLNIPWARELAGVEPTNDPDVMHELANDPLMLNEVRADMVHGVAELMNSALNSLSLINEDRALILYGLEDDVIPADAACIMLERLEGYEHRGLQLVLYPDGYHLLTRDLQAHNTRGDIISWIHDRNSALPSGFETTISEGRERICEE